MKPIKTRLSLLKRGAAIAYREFFAEIDDQEMVARIDRFGHSAIIYELTTPETALRLYQLIFEWGTPDDILPVHKLLEQEGIAPPKLPLTMQSDVGWLLLDRRSTKAFYGCDLTTDPEGIRTIGQLLELRESDLENVDGLGNSGAELVKKRTAFYGFSFSR